MKIKTAFLMRTKYSNFNKFFKNKYLQPSAKYVKEKMVTAENLFYLHFYDCIILHLNLVCLGG